MKWLAITVTAFIIAFSFIAFRSIKNNPPQNIAEVKKQFTIRCSPDWNALENLLEESDIPPMPGAGIYHWKINTSSDSAQFYFNQGINMYYGFHILEALASLKKAAKFDPQNPMVWWAQALAYGPNINDVGYAASPAALEATQKAVSLSRNANPVDKMLIKAMTVRYSDDSSQSRNKLNQDYVDEMKKGYQQFSTNADVAALYADALMLQHPWDLWNNNGTPKSWTPVIRTVLEKLLSMNPEHPGANHYYIHVMEPSPFAAKALPSADRLGRLTPGLSHMVHMPSHIYLRLGQFNKGSQINEDAIKQFEKYSSLFPAANENAFLYQWHNLHMQANCALLAGRYEYGYETALKLQSVLDTSVLSLAPPIGTYVQYLYMTPVIMNVRFGKWNEILKMPQPAARHVYADLLYHFAKGMAYAGLKDFESAEKEKLQLENLIAHHDLTIAISPFSPPVEGAKCADLVLSGFIALKQNKLKEAILFFQKAVETEEKMTYNEPRDWLLNPKQFLGSAYLAAGKWTEAQKLFERDLKLNDENFWSLSGLLHSLKKQNKQAESIKIKKRLSIAMAKTDISSDPLF